MSTWNQRHLSAGWLLAPALLACTLVATGTASADSSWKEQVSVKVKYGDLNLSTDEGAARLYRRITQAARSVCGLDYIQPEERMYVNWKPCYEQAIATAVAQVNSPLLTAMHARKTGQQRLAAVLNGPSSGK
ncbi:MAG TPA: UrcA family protein [Steroidobacteraceae bacterium]|nr:UrcA family protein [Steroidobacteraceae bacterium]